MRHGENDLPIGFQAHCRAASEGDTMSVKAMKQLIELYDKHCYNNDYGGIEFNRKHGYKFIEAIEALRTAIQQVEAQQPARGVPDDVVRDADRYRWLMSWLQQMNLLKAEFGQIGNGEKPSDWWMLNAPYGIDKTRPFFGHGKTADAAIDAAMLAAQAQKGQQ